MSIRISAACGKGARLEIQSEKVQLARRGNLASLAKQIVQRLIVAERNPVPGSICRGRHDTNKRYIDVNRKRRGFVQSGPTRFHSQACEFASRDLSALRILLLAVLRGNDFLALFQLTELGLCLTIRSGQK